MANDQDIAFQKNPETRKLVTNAMYLAKHRIKGRYRYFIRESFAGENGLRGRDLFDLGTDPSRYIICPDDNAFYIDSVVEEQLEGLGVRPDWEELENIFWPFLDPAIKRVIEPLQQRYYGRKKTAKLDPSQEAKIHAQTHIFDKRRMHYLRYGHMDQGYIGRMSAMLLKRLVGKSRDELEQYFMIQEQILRPEELKDYVYVIFDLQRFFKELVAKITPMALDQKKVDEHFIAEICRLNQNPVFWSGHQNPQELHEYLVRYVIVFFDSDYGHSTILDDYTRNFMNRHRAYRPPPPKSTVSVEEASTIFEVKKETLQTITIRELTRLYRSQAKKFHPDKGGEHDKFIKLTEAFQTLLRKIRDKH